MIAATATVERPEPTLRAGVDEPYLAVLPHSKYAVVAERRGFTVPLRVADWLVSADAAPVWTLGVRPDDRASVVPGRPATASPVSATSAASAASAMGSNLFFTRPP